MKRSSTVYVDGDLIEQAKKEGLNISQELGSALRLRLKKNEIVMEETEFERNKRISDEAYKNETEVRRQELIKQRREAIDAGNEEEAVRLKELLKELLGGE